MRIPLHIHPDDQSEEARRRRFVLHMEAAQLNPRGWRTPGKRDGITKPARRKSYMERLTALAGFKK